MSGPSRLEDFLLTLNEVQRRAVSHVDGPLVVFAGAGSGKTRIITTRIAYLIAQGASPGSILAVTFTNKAAREMRERVDAVTANGRGVLIATFHSACARWLREFAPELGFTSDFTIYDDSDSASALKSIAKEFQADLDTSSLISEWQHFIGKMKTYALFPKDVERMQAEYSHLIPTGGILIYKRYQEYLAGCNAMDFGDLILNTLLLLRHNEAVRAEMQRRYKYILVDEYQDTNRTQFELVSILAQAHHNLFVVGDDDQSIYSWRGATPGNILDFDVTYPNAVRVTLEQNYRSTKTIVEAAGAMIANNRKRAVKKLWTDNESGDLITYKLSYDGEAEASWVADSIHRERHRFTNPQIAIFYRTNSQSRALEEALRLESIPYRIYGGVRFYDRLEVKDLLAYFRLLTNPNDDVSFRRIVNVPPRKIGPKALDTLEVKSAAQGISLLRALQDAVDEDDLSIGAPLRGFLTLIRALKTASAHGPLYSLLESVLQMTGYADYLRKKFPGESTDKLENIQELGAALSDFERRHGPTSLNDWLQSVTLSSDTSEDDTNVVSLMTLHLAKGLEFPRVYLVGVEDGLLPHSGSMDDPALLEEERRLMYVGMTRARVKLSLTGAYRRRTYDRWLMNKPSRFLKEIPSRFMESMNERWADAIANEDFLSPSDTSRNPNWDGSRTNQSSASAPSSPARTFQVGASVYHPTFGSGTVKSIEKDIAELKVTVDFATFGMRQVNARHLMVRANLRDALFQ